MHDKIPVLLCWTTYTLITLFMVLFPILIGSLTVNTCLIPIGGNIWLYVQGGLQVVVFGFFFPFCLDTYMYYCTDTQNTIPKSLFRVSLIGTTIGTILSFGWGILGIYLSTQCYQISVIKQGVIGLGIVDLILYSLGSIVMVGMVALDSR